MKKEHLKLIEFDLTEEEYARWQSIKTKLERFLDEKLDDGRVLVMLLYSWIVQKAMSSEKNNND